MCVYIYKYTLLYHLTIYTHNSTIELYRGHTIALVGWSKKKIKTAEPNIQIQKRKVTSLSLFTSMRRQ